MRILDIPEEILRQLNQNERDALQSWLAADNPELSPIYCAQLFELFLNGTSCEHMAALNKGTHLGAILYARIKDRWDKRREEYLGELYNNVKTRFHQTQIETVFFLADGLAAAHKVNGAKIKKYLQSGNLEDLNGVTVFPSNTKNYKDFIEMIMKITGMDKKPDLAAALPSKQEVAELEPKKVEVLDPHDMIKALLNKRENQE